jgi:hypothetical protein
MTTSTTTFSVQTQATMRHNGPGTRSSFDYGVSEFLGPFDTVAEAMAAGAAWQREVEQQGYEVGWIMVDNDETRQLVAEAKSGDVELHLHHGWPLSWDTVEPLPPVQTVQSTYSDADMLDAELEDEPYVRPEPLVLPKPIADAFGDDTDDIPF